MEHYLGEKLKKLRESRGWTQADLAKRLNKAVSTISGYESDAHAIPLDVLASISSLFSISTDELLGLDAPEVLSLSGLTGAQKKTLIKLRNEFLSPSQKGNDQGGNAMRLKNDTNNFAASFNITPPYQMLVLHSKINKRKHELYELHSLHLLRKTPQADGLHRADRLHYAHSG